MPTGITENFFSSHLRSCLGDRYDRAVAIFKNFGPRLSFDVLNVLLHAVDQKKEDEVLTILEQHWNEHLNFQHPNIRGTVVGSDGINKTQQMFVDLCEKVLKLQPVTEL